MVLTTTDPSKYKNGVQNGLSPRELHVHYATVSENAVQETSSAQIIYVYCSPRLKHTLGLLWKLILLTYVVTIPLFIYFLQKESEENTGKLTRLEAHYAKHLKHSEEESAKRVRRDLASNSSLEISLKTFTETYKTKPIQDVEKIINEQVMGFHKKLEVYATKMKNLKVAEDWVNKIYRMYANETSLACDCQENKLVENCDNRFETGKSDTVDYSQKGVRGPRGPRGEQGEKGDTGPPGTPGYSIGCTPIKNNSVTYIRWGSEECHKNTKLLYNGYTSGASSGDKGSGSNYLCLPKKPSYSKLYEEENGKINENYAQITGVVHSQGYASNSKLVYCSVCESTSKTNVIMIPAERICPIGWFTEYNGVLKTQTHARRTEYICVDGETGRITSNLESSGRLDPVVVSSCSLLGCGEEGYRLNVPLSCVVCTK